VLSGQYPTGLIDWGSNAWFVSGPIGRFGTNSVSFNGLGTSAAFSFVGAHQLQQLDVYNSGLLPATVSISCGGQATVSQTVGGGQVATISTGWSGSCSSVTVSSLGGSTVKLDNLVVR
jgi:hypothetical protein